MKPYYIYKTNGQIQYSSQQILETRDNLFLIESNKKVDLSDIVLVKESCYDILDNNFYVMTVIDKITNNITVSYGLFSYCHSLYYYVSDEDIYINLSLKELLKDIKITPVLNIYKVDEFVKYGFIRNEETLVEQIKKVPPLKTYIFSSDKVVGINSEYIVKPSLGNFVDNLKAELPAIDTKILLPLSGGYDSTLLAYLIKDYDEKIAMTVGCRNDIGSEFLNATNTARKLSINLEKIYSTTSWIESFPEIVDIMEGEMFDIGVFLSYFMVERIKELGLTDFILVSGDGADNLLNINFRTEDLDTEPTMRRLEDLFNKNFPKHFFYYVIIKKIEWFLRLDNIDYNTPFMTSNFYECAKELNHTVKKEEYKAFIKNYIPSEISQPLRTRGGQVRLKFFVNNNIVRKFLDILELNKYKQLFSQENTINSDLRNVAYRMFVVFFNYIYIENKEWEDLDFNELLNTILNEK